MFKATIIAECGINHNGDINIAKKLIEGAKDAGADLVKFQKRTIDKVYSQEELNKVRYSPWGQTTRQQKEGLEFTESEYDEINKFCKSINIPWFASPWDLESVKFLEKYNLSYMKIPSPLLTHLELLDAVSKLGKYTFISTGMSTIEEIKQAVDIFIENDCKFELMHCYSVYPAPNDVLNLYMIPRLREIFECDIGYSGHSAGIMDGIIARVLGATSIEKHITLDRTMYGTDQPASLELHGFKKMIEYVRFTEVALGDAIKEVDSAEAKVKDKLRRNKDY